MCRLQSPGCWSGFGARFQDRPEGRQGPGPRAPKSGAGRRGRAEVQAPARGWQALGLGPGGGSSGTEGVPGAGPPPLRASWRGTRVGGQRAGVGAEAAAAGAHLGAGLRARAQVRACPAPVPSRRAWRWGPRWQVCWGQSALAVTRLGDSAASALGAEWPQPDACQSRASDGVSGPGSWSARAVPSGPCPARATGEGRAARPACAFASSVREQRRGPGWPRRAVPALSPRPPGLMAEKAGGGVP